MDEKLKRKRAQLWAKALRESKRKNRNEMRDDKGGRCCLAVACDVAYANGLERTAATESLGMPSTIVKEWFGWEYINPKLKLPGGIKENASAINDGSDGYNDLNHTHIPKRGYTHKQIAEMVLNTFVRKKSKWQVTKLPKRHTAKSK